MLPIINQFNKFDLTAPIMIHNQKIIRQLTHQGEMKLREGPSKAIDVKLYLFTDILLITKSKKKTFGKMKIIKSPMILDKVRFQKMSNNSFACICLNEFNCISSLYHLSNGDIKKVDEWLQKLEDGAKHYSNLKILPLDYTLSREFQNSIPKVKVLKSSPRKNLFRTQISDENLDNNESNVGYCVKRVSPVTRKQKNKKDTPFLGEDVPFELSPLIRKNSQPTLSPHGVPANRRLSKSISFQERDKQVSDNSDVDESIPIVSVATSTLSLNKYNRGSPLFIKINDETITKENPNTKIYQTEGFVKKVETINNTFSKSLSKLDY